MINVKRLVFNAFSENTYILFDKTNDAVVVDCGCSNKDEFDSLIDFINENHLNPVFQICTHLHIDHILGISMLQKRYNIPLYASTKGAFLLDDIEHYARSFGFEVNEIPEITNNVNEGDVISFGDSSLMVLETPGHADGSISLYSEQDSFVIVGDVLFKESIGRTDLPSGDYDLLIHNIKSKLLVLPPEVEVFPGHGPSTTIGEEKRRNPFLIY